MGNRKSALPQGAAGASAGLQAGAAERGKAGAAKSAASDDPLDSIRRINTDQVFENLGTSRGGLSQGEAEKRQARFGKNLIESGKKRSPLLAFLSNFTHLMAVLLWVAGIIAFAAGLPELGVAVWLVNVINGVFSFWQEARASQATEALKKMLPAYATVIRDGRAPTCRSTSRR